MERHQGRSACTSSKSVWTKNEISIQFWFSQSEINGVWIFKEINQLNCDFEPKAEMNSDFQTALTCSSSNILLINLISKQESQDDENYFLVTRRFNHMNINGCKIPGSSIQFNLMSHNHPSCFCGNDFYFCNVGRLFFFRFLYSHFVECSGDAVWKGNYQRDEIQSKFD